MPHECTDCGRMFADGSTEMLSGCPDCDGNRFQYLPDGAISASEGAAGGDGPGQGGSMIEAEPDPDYDAPDARNGVDAIEDRAQADARAGMIDPDQLPPATRRPAGPTEDAPATDADKETVAPPGLDELREQLDERFGSIKIVNRGEYELNLMELYERRECIIELQENGRYVIELPEALTGETE